MNAENKNQKQPERILYVNGGVMNRGGIPLFMMNIYRNIDRTRFQIDFVIHGFEAGALDEEIRELGGKIYHIPIKSKSGMLAYNKAVREALKSYPYRIVHAHMDEMNYPFLLQAKKCGVPIRISHCHTTGMGRTFDIKSIAHMYAMKKLPTVTTDAFACSMVSGKRLYKDHAFYFFPNAIDTKKYLFDANIRQSVRDELGMDEKAYVIGQVGHIYNVKNQLFFEEVFRELIKQTRAGLACKIFWLVIGDGEDRKELEKRIQEHGLENSVILLGQVDKVNKYYQAMDLLVLPSISEGFPICIVEAQCNGLKCILSDEVTKEVDLYNENKFIPLDTNIWVDNLLRLIEKKYAGDQTDSRYLDNRKEQIMNEWDIIQVVSRLENFYENRLKGLNNEF